MLMVPLHWSHDNGHAHTMSPYRRVVAVTRQCYILLTVRCSIASSTALGVVGRSIWQFWEPFLSDFGGLGKILGHHLSLFSSLRLFFARFLFSLLVLYFLLVFIFSTFLVLYLFFLISDSRIF